VNTTFNMSQKLNAVHSGGHMKTLLTGHKHNLALLIGNGINRYGATASMPAWEELLLTIARDRLGNRYRQWPEGISLTEVYDALELVRANDSTAPSLQEQVCGLMNQWKPRAQHKHVTSWALKHEVPLLTTNFDNALGEADNCSLRRTRNTGFTHFYPWDSYYGKKAISDPCASFGIWHVNGMQRYTRSIRLGLSHYMGSVGQVRRWLNPGRNGLYAATGPSTWLGRQTWLQIFFTKPILIFGLRLAENEVFLRWLLIERARYFRTFPDRRVPGWFVHPDAENDPGRLMFLDAVDVKAVAVSSYDDIYSKSNWSS